MFQASLPADPTRPTPLISLRGVGKSFGNGVEALTGLDMDIGPHEFISLVGPSGCGKSTLLRLVAGLSEASAGSITWPHIEPGQNDASSDIGFVFQEPTLMPWATVFDNVFLPLRLKGHARAAVRDDIMQALATVGLDSFANAYPRQLSGGMRMRVSIARAMVTRPRLLLMDEPFAALDEITRLKLNNEFLSLWAESAFTVLFVTHSVYESVYLSSRVLVMTSRPGQIVAEIVIDAPYPRDEVYRTSAHYNEKCRIVSQALRRAMGEADAA